jgi:5'(3')-deoxyribonucleotidase
MDGVLADFDSAAAKVSPEAVAAAGGEIKNVPGLFALLEPMQGAIEAVARLSRHYECHVLSTAPWRNPSAWTDKVEWLFKHFGSDRLSPFYKRVTITHDKAIYKGDYLIDDRDKHGVLQFTGEWIEFGSERFPGWDAVLEYLLPET